MRHITHCFGAFVCWGDYEKVLVRIGLKEQKTEIDWSLQAWTNCIEQLDIDVDVAFFGDSITYGGNWALYFPEKTVINLGYPGDNLLGMQERIVQLEFVKPEKIFIMAGINGLNHYGIEKTLEQYSDLINSIQEQIPGVEIYLESLLPISEKKEKNYGSNKKIEEFNQQLSDLSNREALTFVDLWSIYENNGVMNEYYTKDGLHLQEEGYYYWVEEIKKYIE